MRGGLKFLLAPDIPVELVSGRRLPGEMLPAHFRRRRGWTTGGVAVTVPVRPFDLTRGSTMLVMTQSPTGAVSPGTSDILRLNDTSTYPALIYNSAAGIRYQGVSGGTVLTASDFYNGGVEYKTLWAVSQPGQHEVWIDGTQKVTAADAGFGPLTVTQVILGALNSDVRRLYVAVFDRYLSPDERAEIDRDPAILTRQDTVSVYYQSAATSTASASQTVPAFSQTATAVVVVSAASSHTVQAFGQTATAQNRAGLSAAQTVPAFGQTATASAHAGLSAAQTVPAFSQTAAAQNRVGLSAAQTVPAFSQTATASARVGLSAAQTVPAFGQTANVSAANTVSLSAAQTVLAFGQTATASTTVQASAAQSVPAFSQTANAAVGASAANCSAAQTVPAFNQTAAAAAVVSATASQSVPAFSQSANATVGNVSYASANQTVPAFTTAAALNVVATVQAAQAIQQFGQAAAAQVIAVLQHAGVIPAPVQVATATNGDILAWVDSSVLFYVSVDGLSFTVPADQATYNAAGDVD